MAWGWLQQLVTLPIATWLVKVFWRRKANGGSATPAGVPQANLG
jgi:hypothetical protein